MAEFKMYRLDTNTNAQLSPQPHPNERATARCKDGDAGEWNTIGLVA